MESIPSAPIHNAPATRQDLVLLANSFRTAIHPDRLAALAVDVGVSVNSLRRLGIGWSTDHRAWAFPMRDAAGTIRGFRLRTPAGKKFSVTGGHEGLFIPDKLTGDRLLMCEGPTDTAALLDLGFEAIGRPSCSGGMAIAAELVDVMKPAEVVVVADGDAPGQRGAAALAGVLRLHSRVVRVITPPAGVKDARAWKLSGAKAADVAQLIDDTPPRNLRIAIRAGC